MSNYLKFLLIAIIAVLAYSASLDYDAVKCDDTRLIDFYNKSENTNSGMLSEFSNSYLNTTYYRPLVNISFRLDAELWGQDAEKYHRLNILLHIVFCILLFLTVKRMSGSEAMAMLAALIYSVHPLFANAVAWIPGRNDLMLGVFGLASFYYFDNYLNTQKTKEIALNLTFLLLALFSKETAVILPVLFFVYAYIQDKDSIARSDRKTLYIVWGVAVLVWFALRSMAEKGENANVFGFDVFLSNLRVLPEFLGKFFIPINLSVLPTYSDMATAIGSVILLALTGLLYFVSGRDRKMAAWSLLWFILLVLPTTIFQRGNADEWNDYLYCRSYLPLTGVIFLLAVAFKQKLSEVKPLIILVIGLLPISVFAYLNIQHQPAYTSPVTFYENAIEQDSSRAFYYQIIGNYYSDKGEFDKAEPYFEKAAANQAGYYKRYFQLGEIAMVQKEYSKAISNYKKALDLQPNDKSLLFALSQAYVSSVQLDSAKKVWKKMASLFPKEPEAFFELFNIALLEADYDNLEKYGMHIRKMRFQNQVLSERMNSIAQKAFKNKSIDEALYYWDYAYALDTSNTKLLKYITGSYYVLGEKDSTRKYYNLYKQKGGKLSEAEESTYGVFLK